MKPWIVLLCLSLACLGAQAKAAVWQPAAGHTQLPLWPKQVTAPTGGRRIEAGSG